MPRQLVLWIILFVLSLFAAWIYFHYVWFPYLEWLGHIELRDTATTVYTCGLAMHLAITLSYSKQGRLLILGFPTNIMLGPGGIWPIPNIGHTTITLFGWGLVRVVIDGEEDDDKDASYFRVVLNSRESIHLMHTQASLPAVTMFRAGGALLRFIFGYKKGQSQETISRLGFRIMIIAFVMAWWNNDRNVYVDSVRPVITVPLIGSTFKL